MTVSELIEKLSKLDPSATVRFVYENGDYCNTRIAEEVEDVSFATVRFSEYVGDFKVVETYDDFDETKESPDTELAVVLR